jgi:hypothetical protein
MHVLWFNWIEGADFSKSYYATAQSVASTGPFQLINKQVSTLAYDDLGDFNLLGNLICLQRDTSLLDLHLPLIFSLP